MATDVTMPRLSDSMEEGTILKWIVEEGGEVKRGEPLVEIETDKANMTYEADTDGTLIEVVASEGDTLPIGEVIARIGDAGEKPSGKSEEERDSSPGEDDSKAEGDSDPDEEPDRAEEPEPTRASDGGGGSANGGGERVKASPVARRMARDLGVELAQLEGSGPGGRIVKADVEAAAKGGAKTKERSRTATARRRRSPARRRSRRARRPRPPARRRPRRPGRR